MPRSRRAGKSWTLSRRCRKSDFHAGTYNTNPGSDGCGAEATFREVLTPAAYTHIDK